MGLAPSIVNNYFKLYNREKGGFMSFVGPDLSGQISKWNTLGMAIEGVDKENKVALVANRVLLASVAGLRAETLKHVQTLEATRSVDKLSAAITSLDQLKKKMIEISDSPLFNELTSSDPDTVRQERNGLSLLIGKIDSAILELGTKLLGTKKSKTTPSWNIAELSDPKANDALKGKVASAEWKEWPDITDSFRNPSLIPGKRIQDGLQSVTDVTDMPPDLQQDLPRVIAFKVNGKVVYENSRAFENSPKEAYEKLTEACADDNSLAFKIGCVIGQAVFRDISNKVLMLVNQNEKDLEFIVTGSDQIWSVDIKVDKVVITGRTSYAIREAPKMTPPKKVTKKKHQANLQKEDANREKDHGAIIVKRVIEIPLSELTREDADKNPLTKAKVVDTFSKVIPNAALAEAILEHF